MAATEVDDPALAPAKREEQDRVDNLDCVDSLANSSKAAPEDATGAGEETIADGGNVNNEDKGPRTVTAHLPSPAPSLSDLNESTPPSASWANGLSPYNDYLSSTGLDTDLQSLDGFVSCAVSEADTSATPSAIESSTDTLPITDDIHTTPKKGPRRSPSSARKTRDRSGTKSSDHSGVRRLSASKIQELTASPESLPIATVSDQSMSVEASESSRPSIAAQLAASPQQLYDKPENNDPYVFGDSLPSKPSPSDRPGTSTGTLYTPAVIHRKSSSQPPAPSSISRKSSFQPLPRPTPLNLEAPSSLGPANAPDVHSYQIRSQSRDSCEPREPRESRELRELRAPSPLLPSVPLPPLSAPTLLQLELAAQRPSPLYIHQSYRGDLPYESSAVKFERLKNFLLLPPYIEKTLVFGALACLDAWLWTFTILPLRFCIAFSILFRWWAYVVGKEAKWLVGFVWEGLGRMRERGRRGRCMAGHVSSRSTDGRSRSRSRVSEPTKDFHVNASSTGNNGPTDDLPRRGGSVRTRASTNGAPRMPARMPSSSNRGPFRHRRTKSMPSSLTSFHKADLLQGLIIICSSIALTKLDASRMYHFIRAQSAVKLYVIYNLVEVSNSAP